MFPYKDDTPTQTFPFVTIGIIAINVLAYLWEILSPVGERYIIDNYGAIPSGLLSFEKTQALHPIATVFSSMFLHFYLVSGIIASYAHAISSPSSTMPMIGASGAVSGVLGAYMLLFPHARVHTLLFFGFFIQVVKIPALIVIGFWAIIQLVNGILSQGLLPQGGVAWFAHIGGFLTGLLTIKLWLAKRRFREWS